MSTEQEIKKMIELNEISDNQDPRIEEIADRFPNEYENEQEYVEFQIYISTLIPRKEV